MRRGELVHLRWEDVDFERRLLRVGGYKGEDGEGRDGRENLVHLGALFELTLDESDFEDSEDEEGQRLLFCCCHRCRMNARPPCSNAWGCGAPPPLLQYPRTGVFPNRAAFDMDDARPGLLHITREDDLLLVRVEGLVESGNWPGMADRLLDAFREGRASGMITDVRGASFDLTAFHLFRIAQTLSRGGVPHTCRRALVVSELDRDMRFYENVCLNRGYPLRVVTDAAQARTWVFARP